MPLLRAFGLKFGHRSRPLIAIRFWTRDAGYNDNTIPGEKAGRGLRRMSPWLCLGLSIDCEFFLSNALNATSLLRQTGVPKNTLAIAVMLHLRSPYVSKTAILGCWVNRSGQKS